MKTDVDKSREILVIDVGGTHVKCVANGHDNPIKFKSGAKLTPSQMVKSVLKLTSRWRYHAVSIGYPGVVHCGRIMHEPHNLGSGWVGFDFETAFGCPVKIINDAAMQALGGYKGGKMLFLGLGTGLGSALIDDGVIVTMELGHLHYADKETYEDYLGENGRKRLGNKQWRAIVKKVVKGFRNALLPDYIMLGGGNVKHIKRLPPQTRRGDNAYAFVGGFRLWQQRHTYLNGSLRHSALSKENASQRRK
ncbi:MAG: ROK family protein [Gammaproteobacteria bacterium]